VSPSPLVDTRARTFERVLIVHLSILLKVTRNGLLRTRGRCFLTFVSLFKKIIVNIHIYFFYIKQRHVNLFPVLSLYFPDLVPRKRDSIPWDRPKDRQDLNRTRLILNLRYFTSAF